MNFGSFARYLPASITSSASPPTTCSDFTSSTASDAAGAPTRKGALSFILSPPSSPEPAASLNLQAPGLMMTPIKTIIKRKRTESADLATSMQQLKATCPGVGSFSPSAAIKIEHLLTTNDDDNDSFAPPPQAPMKKSSKFCVVDGCMSRAKHAKRCWRHGGSVKCKVVDCVNRAKSKGVCWSHGGGTLCTFQACDTISVSHGFCWAHGGGKRCVVSQCSKPAYERTQNFCTTHFGEFVAGAHC